MMMGLMRVGILYYVSSTLNPILYSVMSHRYRRALRDTVCPSRSADGRRCFCCGRHAGRNGGRDGQVPCGSSPAHMYELDTRLASRVNSQRFETGSARYLSTTAAL